MNCQKCGAEVIDGTKFCAVCGASVENLQTTDSDFYQTEVLSYNDDKRNYAPNEINNYASGHLNYDSTAAQNAQPQPSYPNYNSAAAQNAQPFAQNFQQNYTVPNFSVLDEKSFYKQFASKSTKGWTTTLIVGCFLTVVSSILPLMSGNIFSILDIAFYLAFGILLIVQKKWYFALPVTIYSGIWTIVTVLMAGAATGILALIAGIASTIKLKKLNEAYKQYKTSGLFPSNMI